MPVLYVVSDQEGAGKTAMCATLAREFGQGDRKVTVIKPVATQGSAVASDADAGIYRDLLDQPTDGWPVDLQTSGLTREALENIREAFHQASQGADVVVAEGSCGLSAEDTQRVAEALDARVLVVARYRRDLSASDLKLWRDQLAGRLIGLVVNGLTRYLGTEARNRLMPSMESEGMPILGVIPEDRRLLGVTVGQLAQHLKGRFVVGDEGTNGGIVEHLMVGGLGMDPGEQYFGLNNNKAVIVRGDRPDLQMAALNTPTACMVLTKGIDPIEYVKYEAEQEEVPVLVVETDTLETMEAVTTLMDSARFDHSLKLDRFGELLAQHLDLSALYNGLGLERPSQA